MDCSDIRTPSLRGIPLAREYKNAALFRGKLGIPQLPTLLLIVIISKVSNISHNRQSVRVKVLVRHNLIWMFKIRNIGIRSSASMCNSSRGRLLYARPWTDLSNRGAAV
jgi:hypothetical protein